MQKREVHVSEIHSQEPGKCFALFRVEKFIFWGSINAQPFGKTNCYISLKCFPNSHSPWKWCDYSRGCVPLSTLPFLKPTLLPSGAFQDVVPHPFFSVVYLLFTNCTGNFIYPGFWSFNWLSPWLITEQFWLFLLLKTMSKIYFSRKRKSYFGLLIWI